MFERGACVNLDYRHTNFDILAFTSLSGTFQKFTSVSFFNTSWVVIHIHCRRACGHGDMGTCAHQDLAATLTLFQPCVWGQRGGGGGGGGGRSIGWISTIVSTLELFYIYMVSLPIPKMVLTIKHKTLKIQKIYTEKFRKLYSSHLLI